MIPRQVGKIPRKANRHSERQKDQVILEMNGNNYWRRVRRREHACLNREEKRRAKALEMNAHPRGVENLAASHLLLHY